MAVTRQGPKGARGQGVSLRRDHGGQPTALAFLPAGQTLGIPQACTSSNNPNGHADTERVMRPLKEEGRWRTEWGSPVELISAQEAWMAHDNDHSLHSARGCQTPRPLERDSDHSHNTPFAVA
jgi:hypothetical protein